MAPQPDIASPGPTMSRSDSGDNPLDALFCAIGDATKQLFVPNDESPPRRSSSEAAEANKEGLEANRNGDTAAAIGLFRRASSLDPTKVGYALSHGNMLLKHGQPEEALLEYDRAERLLQRVSPNLTEPQMKMIEEKRRAASQAVTERRVAAEAKAEAVERAAAEAAVNKLLEKEEEEEQQQQAAPAIVMAGAKKSLATPRSDAAVVSRAIFGVFFSILLSAAVYAAMEYGRPFSLLQQPEPPTYTQQMWALVQPYMPASSSSSSSWFS